MSEWDGGDPTPSPATIADLVARVVRLERDLSEVTRIYGQRLDWHSTAICGIKGTADVLDEPTPPSAAGTP